MSTCSCSQLRHSFAAYTLADSDRALQCKIFQEEGEADAVVVYAGLG